MSRHEGIWTEYRPTYWDGWSACKRMGDVVRCRDCKHGHLTIDGKYNKWCSLLATHDTNGDYSDSPDGYDPEPYFASDFYCAWGERKNA